MKINNLGNLLINLSEYWLWVNLNIDINNLRSKYFIEFFLEWFERIKIRF